MVGRPSKRQKPIFSKNIILRRKALGLSGIKLAEIAKIPYPTLRDIEAGISSGREENRQAIARALHCSMADLYSDGPTPTANPAPHVAPGWAESAQMLHHYMSAERDTRLLALYVLTDDDSYLAEYEAISDEPELASLLKKTLSSS